MADELELKLIRLNNKPDYNIILGQSHFIKTVEDIHEMMVTSVPNIKFGLAFNEASGERLIRKSGTDEGLVIEAVRMVKTIGAGHVFIVVMSNVYPINVLSRLKQVDEVVNIFCATQNPVEVMVAESKNGRGVMGVIDGGSPLGVENEEQVKERKLVLRKIGYKL